MSLSGGESWALPGRSLLTTTSLSGLAASTANTEGRPVRLSSNAQLHGSHATRQQHVLPGGGCQQLVATERLVMGFCL